MRNHHRPDETKKTRCMLFGMRFLTLTSENLKINLINQNWTSDDINSIKTAAFYMLKELGRGRVCNICTTICKKWGKESRDEAKNI